MKRRQFSAILATATASFAGLPGVSGATTDSTQNTQPLEIENLSVSSGGVTTNIGRASFTYDSAERTAVFRLLDWTMAGQSRTLSVERAQVTVGEMAPETFAELRAAMVSGFESRSLSPLLAGAADADVNPNSPVSVTAEAVALDGQPVADQVVASGTVRGAVPEGTRSLLRGGATLEQLLGLGPSEWSSVTVHRGDSRLTANEVTMTLEGTTFAVTSPGGRIETPGRSLQFEDMEMDVRPPEPIPPEHVEFASRLRQLGAQGRLTLSAMRSAAGESGVTVSNTAEAVRRAPFALRFGRVTEEGEVLFSDFETTGQLGELAQVFRGRL